MRMMEYFKRGKESMLLDENNQMITLDDAVSFTAMSLYEDAILYFNGKPKENGEKVTPEEMRLKMDILSALSNAKQALK